MAKDKPAFRTPAKPLSFKKVVKKILANSRYAKFIHGKVIEAREGDELAAKTVAAHFEPTDNELKNLGLKKMGKCKGGYCTETQPGFYMLDFATPAQIWDDDAS